jgi:hypothetical protein
LGDTGPLNAGLSFGDNAKHMTLAQGIYARTAIGKRRPGMTWIDQQREELVRRRNELCRELEELASSSSPVKTSVRQARSERRDRIVAELDDLVAHLADLNVDERNTESMEGRE